jgi:hypothetical protein
MRLRSIFPMSNSPAQSKIYAMQTPEITIRPAYADDQLALQRLASLDSAERVPPHPLLVAEVEGELRVAFSLNDGSAIADPFFPTASILALLLTQAHSDMGRRHAPRRLRAARRPRHGVPAPRRAPA